MDEQTRRNPALPHVPIVSAEEPTRRNPSLPFIPTPQELEAPPEKSPFRVFGTKAFFRLWLSQVFSSTGDWVGLTATLAFAGKLSGGNEYALSGVLVSKLLPGLVFGSLALVLLDRFDKKLLMVGSDLARVVLYASLPFVNNLAMLFMISFLAEIFTLVWGAAKDASIPQLVEGEALQSANSLGLAASYGTFPLAGLVYSGLAALAGTSLFENITTNKDYLAIWFNALTYLVSAIVIFRLPLHNHRNPDEQHKLDWTQTYREAREGLHFIRTHRLVRSVFIGLGGGMIGGGAMIPLGQLYATDVLGNSNLFGVLQTSLGVGATIGVVSLLILQKWLPREPIFALSLIGTGSAIIAAACWSLPTVVMVFIALTGAAAGTAYVTGFTLLQENTEEELRGRTFAAVYTVVRLCLFSALALGPVVAGLARKIVRAFTPNEVAHIFGVDYQLAGSRIALWIFGSITLMSGIASHGAIRSAMAAKS